MQATVQLNDTLLVDDSRYKSSAWKQMVVCREIGHAFGLDHQDENVSNPNLGTCMDYTRDPGSNQHPNSHDYAELESIYAGLDGAGGGGNCPPRNPNCGNGGIGNASPFSEASRASGSVSVDRLPGGVTRVTHVPRGARPLGAPLRNEARGRCVPVCELGPGAGVARLR